MNTLHSLALTLAFAAMAVTAHAEGYNLRGPAPEVGDTVRSETVTKMTDGTMDIDSGQFQLAGKTDMVFSNVTETTVMEMDGDAVTKVRIRIVSESQEQTVEMMGQRNTNTSDGPLNGQTIIATQDDGSWTFELEDGTANRSQRMRLEQMARNYQFFDKTPVVYPDREVEIGESWEVDASDLHTHFGGADRPEGKATYTLDKVEEVDGEPLAYLTVAIDFSAEMTNEGEGKMSMKGRGPLVRSLTTFLDTSSEMKGTMEMHMSEGEDVNVTMSGPMTVTATETRP